MFALEMKLLFELSCPQSSSALWYFIVFIYGIIRVLSYKSCTAKPFLVRRLLFEIQKWNLKSQREKELYPGVCIHICVLNCGFSLGISLDVVMGRILRWPSLQILPPTVYIPFKISRIMTLMNFSPLLRLFYGTINDYLDGLDWVSPVEECGSLYELRGVASKEVGTSVPQPAVLDFCQQEWAWKQIFPQNLQMRTHPISFSFKQRTQWHHARFFYRTVYCFTALSLW